MRIEPGRSMLGRNGYYYGAIVRTRQSREPGSHFMAIDTRQIGVIGLGLMGTAITERLLEHGYSVWVWNRTPEKAQQFLERGARWSDNPIAECERVVISLYSSDVVAQVIDSMGAELRAGQI